MQDKLKLIFNRRLINNFILLIIGLVVLTACKTEENILSGNRESLLKVSIEQIRKVDSTKEIPYLAKSVECKDWTQFLLNSRHLGGHCKGIKNTTEVKSSNWNLNNANIEVFSNIGSPVSYSKMLISVPVSKNGIGYFIKNKNLIVALPLNKLNNRPLWVTSLPSEYDVSDGEGGGLAISKDNLIVTSGVNMLASLSLKNGEILWVSKTPEQIRSAPVSVDNQIYVKGVKGSISAFDLNYGNRLWYTENKSDEISFLDSSVPAFSSKLYSGTNLIIVGLIDGSVKAVRPFSGIEVWQTSLSPNIESNSYKINDIGASPIITDEYAIIANFDGIAALDLASGIIIWQQPIYSRVTPWVSGQTIFVVSSKSPSGLLSALRVADGLSYWNINLNSVNNKNHNELEYWFTPIHYNNSLIIYSSFGTIIRINPLTGKVYEYIKLSNNPISNAIVTEGFIFIPNKDGSFTKIS